MGTVLRTQSLLILLVLVDTLGSALTIRPSAFAMTLDDLSHDRRVNWQRAGYQGDIPSIKNNIINVKQHGIAGSGVVDESDVIQNLINSANDPAVLYFPPGRYRIQAPLSLKSGIILRGAGSNSTIIECVSDGGCIEIYGRTNGSYQPITHGPSKGSTLITVADSSGFSVGKGGEIRQEDIDEVDPTGEWGNNPDWTPTHVMGQMVRVTAINGNTLTIDPPLHISFRSDKQPEIRPVSFVEQVGVEDLTIKRIDTGTISNNINIRRAANCWFQRIESDQTQKYHFGISQSLFLEIRGCYIHDAYHKGGGGRGYGTSLGSYVTSVLVEDNIFSDLRHSMIIQLGTNGSVFGYNYAQRNYSDDGWDKTYISVHGHYPYMNLFEGNIVGYAGLADYWGASGPGNTLFRNRMIGTDKHKDFGPYRGIAVDDYSHKQNIIGNELTGGETRITFDGHTDKNSGTSRDVLVHGNTIRETITWDPTMTDRTLPASFYLTNRPSFFGELPWPSLGPDMVIGRGTIPALERYKSKKYVVQPDETPARPGAPLNLLLLKE